MSFLPRNFVVPARIETERFVMRSITIHDAFKDYDAVMSSREHLWSRFGDVWGWPPENMTIEDNIVDLGWHQKEFKLRSSFDYALMSPDESRLLGCVYIDPSSEEGLDAEVWFWARSSEVPKGLELFLEAFLPEWLSTDWPFAVVSINGNQRTFNRRGEA